MGWSFGIKTPGCRSFFFKGKIIINEIEASLTGASIEQSDSGMKSNLDFLQETEVVSANADLT